MQALSGTPGFHQRIDETGNRYGRLIVVSFDRADNQGNAVWLCHCDCGEERLVRGYILRQGRQVSCGCWHDEQASLHMTAWNNGATSALLRKIWKEAKARKEGEQQNA